MGVVQGDRPCPRPNSGPVLWASLCHVEVAAVAAVESGLSACALVTNPSQGARWDCS